MITIAFLPIMYNTLAELYPETISQTRMSVAKVQSELEKMGNVVSWGVVGNEVDAVSASHYFSHQSIDIIVLWECGYVPAAIPYQVIKPIIHLPLILLVTQKEKTLFPEMTYAKYMMNTAYTGTAEFAAVLKKSGKKIFSCYVGHQEDKGLYEEVFSRLRTIEVVKNLQSLRIGNIGFPYPGMLDISVDQTRIQQLGPTVEHVSLEELKVYLNSISEEKISQAALEISKSFNVDRIENNDLVRVARLYCAYDDLIRERTFNALCVHDYDYVSTVSHTVSDVPLSMLEYTHDLVTSVEGDLTNIIGAYLIREFSGLSPIFADWTMLDEQKNAVFFQHNGKMDPRHCIKPELAPSAEPFGGVSGQGAVVESMAKDGKVTLVSLLNINDNWQMVVARGESLPVATMPCQLNQIVIEFEKSARLLLQEAAEVGISHHLNIGYGDLIEPLEKASEYMGIKIIKL